MAIFNGFLLVYQRVSMLDLCESECFCCLRFSPDWSPWDPRVSKGIPLKTESDTESVPPSENQRWQWEIPELNGYIYIYILIYLYIYIAGKITELIRDFQLAMLDQVINFIPYHLVECNICFIYPLVICRKKKSHSYFSHGPWMHYLIIHHIKAVIFYVTLW